jgi:pimeloyl-ACP methyl ester carboxylesterase
MEISTYYPYRSEAARDACYAYLDALAARQWPVAAEERTVSTTYGNTFVRISGPTAGAPLVLLHGAASTSLMWAPNIEALSARYRTFAVDQIGDFGKSICTRPVASFRDLLDWLDRLFDGLKLSGGVNLVGISYGGALAVQYALHSPGRVGRVVMLAPANTILRVRAAFWVRMLLSLKSRRKGMATFIRWIFSEMERKDPQWVEMILEQLALNMRSLERRWPPIPPLLADAEWRSLTVPALFLVGQHDVIYSAEKAVRRLRRVAPQVTAEIVPGAGHDLTVAHADLINRRILEFLGERSAVPAADRARARA